MNIQKSTAHSLQWRERGEYKERDIKLQIRNGDRIESRKDGKRNAEKGIWNAVCLLPLFPSLSAFLVQLRIPAANIHPSLLGVVLYVGGTGDGANNCFVGDGKRNKIIFIFNK